MKDYSMYRYFKGEDENPFEVVNGSQKHAIAEKFWYYECVFERDFIKNESSEWFAFFGGEQSQTAQNFMKLLSEEDYERPTEKKKAAILELWLNEYLFPDKLNDWGGAKDEKDNYYSTSAQQLQGQ